MLPHQIFKQYVVQEITTGQRIDSIQLYQVELKRMKARLLFPPKAELKLFQWWLSVLRFSREYTDERIKEWQQAGIEIPGVMLKALERLRYSNWSGKLQWCKKWEYRIQVDEIEEFEDQIETRVTKAVRPFAKHIEKTKILLDASEQVVAALRKENARLLDQLQMQNRPTAEPHLDEVLEGGAKTSTKVDGALV